MRKILNFLLFVFFTLPIATLVGVLAQALRLTGQTRVIHPERIHKWKRKLIVVSNHPSLLETVQLPATLFFTQFFLNHRYFPWSTPDKKNFYDKWYWAWIRPISIAINRASGTEERRALRQMQDTLNQGGVIIIFAEGGRTFKGDTFLYSESGRRIRKFTRGVGLLVNHTRAHVLPIWVDGTDDVLPNHPTKLFAGINFRKRVTIKVGRTMRFDFGQHLAKADEITQKIEQAVLALADEE